MSIFSTGPAQGFNIHKIISTQVSGVDVVGITIIIFRTFDEAVVSV